MLFITPTIIARNVRIIRTIISIILKNIRITTSITPIINAATLPNAFILDPTMLKALPTALLALLVALEPKK